MIIYYLILCTGQQVLKQNVQEYIKFHSTSNETESIHLTLVSDHKEADVSMQEIILSDIGKFISLGTNFPNC